MTQEFQLFVKDISKKLRNTSTIVVFLSFFASENMRF